MDDQKLKRIGEDLAKARAKQREWEERVKILEKKYREAENTCIHDIVHAADLTPEQLAVIIRRAREGRFGVLPDDIGRAGGQASQKTEKPDRKENPGIE